MDPASAHCLLDGFEYDIQKLSPEFKICDFTGDTFGYLEEIVIDDLAKTPLFALFSKKPIKQKDDDLFIIPANYVSRFGETSNFILNVPLTQIRGIPHFTRHSPPDFNNDKLRVEVFRYFYEFIH